MGFAEAVEAVAEDEDECSCLLASTVIGASSSSSSPSSLRNGRGRFYEPCYQRTEVLGQNEEQLTLGPEEERSLSLEGGQG
jgi:hypothetical protein